MLNLISDPWIPVRRKDGTRVVIAPWQVADDALAFPDWPRPDLNIACLELLAGLVFLADPPADADDWDDRKNPDPERLRAALAPFAPAFELLGDGPRFMQDLEPFEKGHPDPNPPDTLFIDSGGENTFKKNADLLVKRGRYGVLDLPLAAMALFTTQAYAYADSAKHHSSLRDNGPLVTLVDPGDGLWSIIWANLPYGNASDPQAVSLPWRRKILSTGKAGQPVYPPQSATLNSACHPPEIFFGCPWRMRLVETDGKITGFVRLAFGIQYEQWLHPYTPYERLKASEPLQPVKARPGFMSYRNWAGVVHKDARSADDTKRRAEIIDLWDGRSREKAEMIVAGWAMSKAKVLDFTYSRTPVLSLSAEIEQRLQEMAEAAKTYAFVLRSALKPALREQKPGDGVSLNALRETFYVQTQGPFEARLAQLAAGAAGVGEAWLSDMREVAFALFDSHALPGLGDRDTKDQAEIVAARRNLRSAFAGYGKLGGVAYQALGLPIPEQKKGKAA